MCQNLLSCVSPILAKAMGDCTSREVEHPCDRGRVSNEQKIVILQRARELCKQIRSIDELAPKHVLRAAEQSLATLESWLKKSFDGYGSDEDTSFARSATPLRGREQRFFELFDREDQDESLMNEMQAFAKSYSFLFPGRLYISSSRVCFHSQVMDVEVDLAVPWSNIKSIRLLDADEAQAVAKVVYAIRVEFSEALEFDGQNVQSLDFRLFNHKSVAQVHRSASMFTGSGLFEDLQDDDDTMAPTKSRLRTVSRFPTSQAGCESIWDALTGEHITEKVELESAVWELEYRAPFKKQWIARVVGEDQKNMRWARISGDAYTVHPDIDSMNGESTISEPPIRSVEILGRRRECSWECVQGPETDADGWQYAVDFHVDPLVWGPVARMRSHARRRRWNPILTGDKARDAALSFESIRSLPVTHKASTPKNNRGRCCTTIMKDKGLADSQDSATPLVEIVIGKISLKTLGEMFLRDDWVDEGPMAEHFKSKGAKNVQIGAWATGGAVSQVRGKVRSGEMVVPIPPMPMCPKETRLSVTYHVLASPTLVIFETSTMSHDVPYGACFNLVICDRFTLDSETGDVILTRLAALEWLQSCWLQKQVEKGSKAALKPDAETWAAFWRDKLSE